MSSFNIALCITRVVIACRVIRVNKIIKNGRVVKVIRAGLLGLLIAGRIRPPNLLKKFPPKFN